MEYELQYVKKLFFCCVVIGVSSVDLARACSVSRYKQKFNSWNQGRTLPIRNGGFWKLNDPLLNHIILAAMVTTHGNEAIIER